MISAALLLLALSAAPLDLHFADPAANPGALEIEAQAVPVGAWVALDVTLPAGCEPVRVEWAGNYGQIASSPSPSRFYALFPATLKAHYSGLAYGHVGIAPRGPGCSGSVEAWVVVQ